MEGAVGGAGIDELLARDPTMAAVLDLAADGLTTAQIATRLALTPRQVQQRVSAAIRELGVANRAAAVAMVAAQRERAAGETPRTSEPGRSEPDSRPDEIEAARAALDATLLAPGPLPFADRARAAARYFALDGGAIRSSPERDAVLSALVADFGRLAAPTADDNALASRLFVARAEVRSFRTDRSSRDDLERAIELARTTDDVDTLAWAVRRLPVLTCSAPGGADLAPYVEELRELPGLEAALGTIALESARCLLRGTRAELDRILDRFGPLVALASSPEWEQAYRALRATDAYLRADAAELPRRIDELLDAGAHRPTLDVLTVYPILTNWRMLTDRFLPLDFAKLPGIPSLGVMHQSNADAYAVTEARHGRESAVDQLRQSAGDAAAVAPNAMWVAEVMMVAATAAIAGRGADALAAAELVTDRLEEFVTSSPYLATNTVGGAFCEPFAVGGDPVRAFEAAQAGLTAARRMAAPLWILRGLTHVLRYDPGVPAAHRAAWLDEARDLTVRHEVPDYISQFVGRPGPAQRPDDERLLDFLAAGYSNRQIAAELHLDVSTVERRLSALYRRLGVKNRNQAAARTRGARTDAGGPAPGPSPTR